MAKPGKTGLARIIDATAYSIAGLKAAWQHEAAFRQESLLMLLLLPLAIWLGETPGEKAIMVFVSLLLPLFELVNSSIEAVVDRISSEHHELAGRAKDIGSALVFVSLLNILIVWSVIIFS